MATSVDLAKQAPTLGWSLQGFAPTIETDGKKTWRSVIGKKATVNFFVPKNNIYQIKYKYFTVVKPLIINTYIDKEQVESIRQPVFVNGYGYTIIKLSEGSHTLVFEFDRVRQVTSTSKDKRPIPVAFSQLEINVKDPPVGILGNGGIAFSFFLCLLLILLSYRFLLGHHGVDADNNPEKLTEVRAWNRGDHVSETH